MRHLTEKFHYTFRESQGFPLPFMCNFEGAVRPPVPSPAAPIDSWLSGEKFMAYDAIVIGTGFGGTIAAVQLVAQGKKVLLLERGTFWRSPDPLPLTPDKFGKWAAANNMPVQYWPRPDHRKGLQD